ncbi:copper acquisition factor BIM1-like domain-containing protein [Aspergillus thermomutatus]|uniref:Copper acquisition factor BIM1-like domain-containing protein n=1 Tax=Aspergillus thermomutatus TaxID=41047 RepID=A0A397HLC0_ASPTH|nr:uncharacterized protein CDV56_109251 [Aspergillus thermomutatus]RHZ63925.1 hypothetical protein CDV56_109251 [Aspergillus thermomutatus]
MVLQSSISQWAAFIALLCAGLANAHTVITYPGYRGNNLHTNGSVEEANGGGMPTSTNRTKWPVGGGAVAFQPGWFQGHQTALIYINLGLGTVPPNMSHPMISPFQITGPTNNPYPGTICLPQVPLPANISVSPGDHATIQVIETAKHGAALYNCVDIEFAEPTEVEEVTRDNCFNSSIITFGEVFTTTSLTSAAAPKPSLMSMLPVYMIALFSWAMM